MRKIKLLTLLAALLFSAGMYVQAEIASGTCGTNLAWSLSDDYALTISGTGTTMTDYSPASPAPWNAHKANIVSITLPETLYKVGAYAFAGCNKVTTLTIPASVSVIGKHALDMTGLASLYVMNHTMPPSRGQEAYSEIFPGHAANLKIYFHQDMVDWFCQSWVPYIHYLMPYDYIAEVESPSSMPTPTAAGTCGTNVNWYLYNGVLAICGPGTVMDNFANADVQPWAAYRDNIGTVHIEGRITNVGNYAFADCNKVGWIFLPDALTTIGSHAFDGCRKLEYARSTNPYPTMNGDIPEGVTSIGDAAFYNCDYYYEYGGNYYGFTQISLPSTLTSLGANNFVGCTYLQKVEMNATTPPTLAGVNVEGLPSLMMIFVPAGAESAYANAENWIMLWDFLYKNGTVQHLPLPAGSGSCGNNATWSFSMAQKDGGQIDKLSGYDGTLTISGSGAMANYTSATAPWHVYRGVTHDISLSKDITTIGNYAFDGFADAVKSITCRAVTPPTVGSGAFGAINNTIPVYVPAASVNAYKAADNWKEFTNIQSIVGEPEPEPVACDDTDEYRGSCGTNLSWLLTCDGKLVINATGERISMTDYSPESPAPWYAHRADIVSITLPENLIKVGAYAFAGCNRVTTLTIPASVIYVGKHAFDMESLASLYITPPTENPALAMIPSRGEHGEGEIFPHHAANLKIYYMCGAQEGYINAWSPYYDYLEPHNFLNEDECLSAKNPAATASGTFGNGWHWTFIENIGLIISGNGQMPDFANAAAQPWAAYRDKIWGVMFEGVVTHIGAYAFADCNKIHTILLPESLTSIGSYAFSGCSSLWYLRLADVLAEKNAEIPEGVTSIGDAVFYGCSYYSEEYQGGFTQIKLPSTLTSLGANNFVNCEHLQNVWMNATTPPALGAYTEALSQSLYIWCPVAAKNAYANAENWIDLWDNLCTTEDLHLPLPSGSGNCGTGVTWAFEMEATAAAGAPGRRNTPAKLADYKGTLTISGNGAMDDYEAASAPWHKYKKVTNTISLPAGLTKIGDNAFDDFGSNVESITCEATTPPTVGTNAFGDIPATTPVIVPSTSAYAAVDAWSAKNLQSLNKCGDNLYWELTSGGALIITGTGAMYDFDYPTYGPWNTRKSEIKSISLPEGLTKIGNYAFYQMDEMNTAVVVPEGVTSIGYCAFSGERKLPAITLPNSLRTLAGSVFSAANALTSLHIPANVNSIGTGLTEECNALTSITVDANNQTFDSRNNCNAVIKKSNNTLVAGCKTTVIPSTVTTIGAWAFSSIKTLTSLNLPASVTTLGDYAFQYCSGLKELTIPSKVTAISGTAFTGCSFEYINVYPANSKFDSRDNCLAVVETATNKLVKGCSKTVIPDEVTALGEGAFMSCNDLKFINIPANVNRLEKNALIYCKNLEAITCFATTPPTADNLAFNYGDPSSISINPAIPVYVPAGSIDAYRSAANWNYFTNFVPLSGGETTYYTVKALANHGTVNGTGTYAAGTAITLTPVADEGFVFEQWSDGTKVSPKSLTVTEDMTIRALFKKDGETEEAPVVAKSVPNVITFNFQPILLAYVYKVMIFENGLRVLEIILDENGAIKSTQNVSSAPSRLKARRVMNSAPSTISLSLSNLQVGQQYTYTVDTYDASDACISARAGSFNVSGGVVMGDQSTAGDITSILSAKNGSEVADLSIIRTIQRNGYFSTLCLPFSMNATQIANSSLAGADIKQFTSAEVADDQLNIAFEPVDEIEAGKPYLIRYSSAEALNRLDFSNVTIDADVPEQVNYGNVKMEGTYTPLAVTVQESATTGDCLLFLGANNTLYWPNTSGTIKPFRCYFIVSTGSGSAPLRRGMPVRIVEAQNTATNVEAVGGENTNAESIKVIENGVMYIIRNGEKYNAMGQIVK